MKLIFAMSILNYIEFTQKYKQYWKRKSLSLSSFLLLKVSVMQALVLLELELGLEV